LFRVFRALMILFRRNGGHKISRFAPRTIQPGRIRHPRQKKSPACAGL